jgi:YNFM family putative membrane transporter
VLIMRALIGLSLSGLAAVAMTYLSEEIHPQHIGLAMGLYIGGNAIGGMSGRLITGVLIDFVSWHTAMLVIGGLALIAAAVFWKILPESRNFRSRSLHPRSLLDGFTMHFRDAGLPLLFLEAFVLMGAFVTLFNYIGYRLLAAPYNLDQVFVGLLSVVYLSGIYSSAKIGSLADKLGRRKVLWATIALMFAGLALTMFTPLLLVIVGMLIFTFGFFAAHSVASSWIGRRATKAKGQASSLYLFSYYAGSSIAGTAGGVFWHLGGWNGIGLFIGALLLVALLVALKLAKLPPLGGVKA